MCLKSICPHFVFSISKLEISRTGNMYFVNYEIERFDGFIYLFVYFLLKDCMQKIRVVHLLMLAHEAKSTFVTNRYSNIGNFTNTNAD